MKALLDSGATGLFMDTSFAKEKGFKIEKLKNPPFVRDVQSGSGVTPEWKGFDNKSGGTTLASARVLCLDLLSHMWLCISGGLNCCQESRRGVV